MTDEERIRLKQIAYQQYQAARLAVIAFEESLNLLDRTNSHHKKGGSLVYDIMESLDRRSNLLLPLDEA